MTKAYLLYRQQELITELQRVHSQLKAIDNGLIADKNKKFEDYTINEMQNLSDINEKAFKYLCENRDKTALDYNNIMPIDKQIIFNE